ncbi:MAG: aminopeptidase [Candidatus Aenigmatarchaeota archaeon]|nr:aminopeptidase [Candidatus Aenigmarchaeota archaeon]
MHEKDLEIIAKNIININLGVKEKDIVLISAGPNSLAFAEALAYEAAMIGAQTTIHYSSDELALKIYRDIKERFLKNWPRLADILSKVVDVSIIIDDTNPFAASKIPQNKVEIRRKIYKPIRRREEKREKRKELRKALIGFPNLDTAKALGISFKKLNEIYWNTMKADYEKIYKFNSKLIKVLNKAKTIRIVGERTDITFSVKGRKFMNGCGIVEKKGEIGFINLPDGEVYIAPIEDSVSGEIYFDLPCLYHYGKKVKGVYFKFNNGKLIEYEIKNGLKEFEDVYKNASGDKNKIGEFGIGTNPNARITGGMTIIDEKVISTIHLAIGDNKSFGGKNDATIHWDFFKDMKKGGSIIYADKKIIMKNGEFVGI